MARPFWRDLIHQDKLEAQYEVLCKRGTFSDKEIALHLARFAEAHIYNAADARITELEAGLTRRLWRWLKQAVLARMPAVALALCLMLTAACEYRSVPLDRPGVRYCFPPSSWRCSPYYSWSDM